jgi:hypothetical protein
MAVLSCLSRTVIPEIYQFTIISRSIASSVSAMAMVIVKIVNISTNFGRIQKKKNHLGSLPTEEPGLS